MRKLDLAAIGLLALCATALAQAGAQPVGRPVALVELDGTVNPGSADFLVRAIGRAQQDGAEALVIRLDTPGGMVDSTREIVKAELGSSVPVIVWVGPGGARAGSAGVFVTLASHLAAMAPATNIGAAHPISMGPGGSAEKQDETVEEKAVNDLAAWAESIAAQRGRNASWSAEAVRKSVSVPAEEAIKLKVVELLAPTLEEVLKAADGRTVQTSAGSRTLATAGAVIQKLEMTPRERFLDALGNPNIAFLFIGLGVLGILAELYHPGTIFPGVLGAISFAIGMLATRMLPVNTGAIVLIVVGAALIAAEFFVTSFGLLAIGGVVCLAIGAFLLVDPSEPGFLVDKDFGVTWSSVLPIILVVGGTLALVVWKVAASRTRPQVSGAAGLVGEVGTVADETGPAGGRVYVHGELWAARSAQPIPPERRVRVISVEGLVVTVAEVDTAARPE